MPRYSSSTDVARLAGVSQSAVSRAFTPGASIAPATREKVMAAAEELGYQPSLIPQIMLNHRSYLIAVVIGELYNPCYWMLLEHFIDKLQKVGHQVLLVNVESGHFLDAAIPRFAGYRVDAIISTLPILSPRSADELAKLRIPVVLFNNWVMNEWVSSVSCDNAFAAEQIADLLAARGAKNFAFVAGPEGSPASDERQSAYAARLAQMGFDPLTVVTGNFRYEGGHAAALQLMQDNPNRPDAIFCGNDLMALGVTDALRNVVGMRVPEDVMIVGFDDIPAASWDSYNLTTVAQAAENMVDEALKMVMGEARHHDDGNHVVVPTRLIERSSTGRPATSSL